MITTIHTTVSVVNIFTMFICGFILLVSKLSNKASGQVLKSRIILAASIELVAFVSLLLFMWENQYFDPRQVFALPVLVMSIIQCAIFYYGIMMMVKPDEVTVKKIFKSTTPALIVMALYGISIIFEKDYSYTNIGDFARNIYKIPVLLRLGMFAVFMHMLFLYFRQYRLITSRRKTNPSIHTDIHTSALRSEQNIINIIFYAAFATGIATCIYAADPIPLWYIIIATTISLIYVAFTFSYIHLGSSNAVIKSHPKSNSKKVRRIQEQRISKPKEQFAQRRPKDDGIKNILISMIVDEHFFTQPNISINHVAERLNITPRALSTYISTEYEQSFASWINELRIEYAKQCIYESGPNYILDVEQLSNHVGFTNTEEFSGFFKDYTSKTPVDYVNLLKVSPKTQK